MRYLEKNGGWLLYTEFNFVKNFNEFLFHRFTLRSKIDCIWWFAIIWKTQVKHMAVLQSWYSDSIPSDSDVHTFVCFDFACSTPLEPLHPVPTNTFYLDQEVLCGFESLSSALPWGWTNDPGWQSQLHPSRCSKDNQHLWGVNEEDNKEENASLLVI